MRKAVLIPLIISFIFSSGKYDVLNDISENIQKVLNGDCDIKPYSMAEHTLGSAQELDGRILVVSVFADDTLSGWDISGDTEDRGMYDNVHSYLGVATDWISESGKKYGKDITFVWDWEKYSDLYYQASFDTDFPQTIDSGESDTKAWEYIESSIDSDALMNKYDADSIVYMMYFDTTYENQVPTCTRNYYEGMPYPYEICFVFLRDVWGDQSPAIFAHEMLHTFGAPDLYAEDWQFGVTEEYAAYARSIKLNDIMRICDDVQTGESYRDRIVNEITEITAYYIGWTDSSETVDRWHFGRSEHISYV